MVTINPYVNFDGNAEEAFNLYKSVFGGEFASIVRYKDSPEGNRAGPKEQDKIMHISLPVGKGNILMATDALESMGHPLKAGNNFSLSITAETQQEADKVFNGLSTGGKVLVPMGKASWGTYFGMFYDRFGIQWMISFDPNRK